jgi:DNA helicase-2/ATP-dependent DNA helicase PcrA
LNPEQRAAVLHTEGPLLILAGAGTGKTRTIVHRIAHLIDTHKVEPANIIAVTFTNRAADEMRERVESYVGEAARAVTLSTFHSLGVRIMREHTAKLGLPKRFAVYGTSDQLAALRTATSEVSIGNDRYDLKRILWQISDWKSKKLAQRARATSLSSRRRPARVRMTTRFSRPMRTRSTRKCCARRARLTTTTCCSCLRGCSRVMKTRAALPGSAGITS